eukprot:scaffold29011_cov111-Isochrysis_galbana.AAC.3
MMVLTRDGRRSILPLQSVPKSAHTSLSASSGTIPSINSDCTGSRPIMTRFLLAALSRRPGCFDGALSTAVPSAPASALDEAPASLRFRTRGAAAGCSVSAALSGTDLGLSFLVLPLDFEHSATGAAAATREPSSEAVEGVARAFPRADPAALGAVCPSPAPGPSGRVETAALWRWRCCCYPRRCPRPVASRPMRRFQRAPSLARPPLPLPWQLWACQSLTWLEIAPASDARAGPRTQQR